MKLESEFFRLPLRFDVERLQEEVSGFAESDWMAHPMNYAGNSSIPLISVNGQYNDDFVGAMLPTPALEKSPYIKQVLSSFDSVFGRSRLMRLGPGCEVPAHADITYHWYSRVRIHVPITTDPDIAFYCNQKKVHMAPGEAWIFDSWKVHRVVNPSKVLRVHLVADTAGSAAFWDMVADSDRPHEPGYSQGSESRFIPYTPGRKPKVRTERHNSHVVMAPGEVDALLMDLVNDVRMNVSADASCVEGFIRSVNRFRLEWRETWYLYGTSPAGWPKFQLLIQQLLSAVVPLEDRLALATNQADAVITLKMRVLSVALNTEYAQSKDAGTKMADISSGNRRNVKDKMRKVGRNDPCPCGSGKKYKLCHG